MHSANMSFSQCFENLSPSLTCLLAFLSLEKQKLTMNKSILPIFSFVVHVFCVFLRKYMLNPMSQKFPKFSSRSSVVWDLIFRSIKNFYLNFCIWYEKTFFPHISPCFSPRNNLSILFKNHLTI